eukprot:scaffold629639_cov48-Prasinocladus_malaysianus.AAC.1
MLRSKGPWSLLHASALSLCNILMQLLGLDDTQHCLSFSLQPKRRRPAIWVGKQPVIVAARDKPERRAQLKALLFNAYIRSLVYGGRQQQQILKAGKASASYLDSDIQHLMSRGTKGTNAVGMDRNPHQHIQRPNAGGHCMCSTRDMRHTKLGQTRVKN